MDPGTSTIEIKPVRRMEGIDFAELAAYRDLFFFLVWRDIKVLYAQTVLGLSWAILNPLIQIVIFSVVFGKVARVSTDGIPYVLFSTAGVIPWTYISESMRTGSTSLVTGQGMLGKVYFPRLIYPLTPVLAKLMDFTISLVVLVGVMIYYRVVPTWNLLLLPGLLLMMICVPAGVNMWLSALSIRFRDVKFVVPFAIRMLVYTAPIVYTASGLPGRGHIIYSLNPLVGVVEGFRSALLGTAIPWQSISLGAVTSVLILVTGAIYFRRFERVFVDVI